MRDGGGKTRSEWAFLTAMLAVVALVVSCAPKQAPQTTADLEPPPPGEPQPVAPPLTEPEPQQFYDRLAEARELYEAGIELIAAGEEVLGEERVATASQTMRQAAEDCAAVASCDLAPFFDEFALLLDQQTIALKRQAFHIEELEAGIEEDLAREPGSSPYVATLPELNGSYSLLRGTDLRLRAYELYQFLRPEMAPVYEEAGLPEALLFAMVATESGGKVHAFSRAGAAGPLQFMRRTGQLYGLGMDDGFDQRLDPTLATRANVAYLMEQFEALDNSLEKALGAYNGGENRMQSLHRRYKNASFWDSRIYYSLPRETREYVPRVLAAAWLYLHPGDYGLEFPTFDTTVASLEMREPISVGELSICLGQRDNVNGWFRTLRNLNPRLGPGDRLESGDQIRVPAFLVPLYEEHCLQGDLVERARVLHDANYPDEPEMIVYTVRKGDTLGRIASRFRCASVRQIAEINRVRAPRYVIHVGQQLKIPDCS
jgi:membrane-bound lytic murein transglycosylase D